MGAPQARLWELAVRLRDKGHQVSVLTAMPNYPTGKVFKDYRWRLRKTEDMEGIRVTRTCIIPSNSSKTLPRLLSYMTFVFSSVMLGIWGLGKQDVVLFESPPLFLIPAGLTIGRLCKAKVIMNCSDIWPDLLIRTGHLEKGLALKAMLWLEAFGYNHSDVVAVTNPGAVEQVKDRFPDVETTVISNGVDTKFFRSDLRSDEIRDKFGARPDDFLVGYCGLHGIFQGLEVIIDAADKLKDHKNIKFIMIGDGPTKESLVKAAEEKGLANLTFYDRVTKDQMPGILASCDVSLVPLSGRLPGTMPSKVYEALASGTPPIVAKACEGDTLVSQFNAGRTFEPLDGEDLAKAILDLAENPQELSTVRFNAIELSRRFDRDAIAERTEGILLALVEGRDLPDVSW